MKPDLTICIITSDNQELLLPCLESVFANTNEVAIEVFVVDNASSDDSAVAVKRLFPHVTVVRNEKRLGFSTNNNLVLHQGQGRYLMLLNDDTVVLDGALDRLVSFMDSHPRAGAVGGFLLNADGSFQPAFSRFPHPIMEALIPATNWSYRWARKATEPFEVDSVCGAAMVVRRDVIDQVGILDTLFDPIYSEEVDWCFRIKRAGWAIYTLPQAQVIHYGGQTMNRAMPHKYELLLSHKMLFFQKHHGAVAANLYRVTLGLSTAFKILWWTVAALVGRNSQNSRERIQLHRYVLRRIPSLKVK